MVLAVMSCAMDPVEAVVFGALEDIHTVARRQKLLPVHKILLQLKQQTVPISSFSANEASYLLTCRSRRDGMLARKILRRLKTCSTHSVSENSTVTAITPSHT